MVRRDTSTRLFRARINYLVEARGRDEVARSYGVTPRTIGRWERGDTTPSLARRTSVSRAALRRGAAPAMQVRTRGRFTREGTIATSGSQRAVEVVNLRMIRTRRAEIADARRSGSAVNLAAARALPQRLDRTTADALALSRERLVEQGASAPSTRVDVPYIYSPEEMDEGYWDMFYDWESWRDAYEEMAGYGDR
tara:strand:+ start:1660 stop:2244 length:585 start_codon:yes stop_codon:yes gene_type:complete